MVDCTNMTTQKFKKRQSRLSDTESLQLAYEAANSSDCLRRHTGAVLVVGNSPLITACNGTPNNTLPCSKGGCPRCASDIPPLQGYDICACVHAEVNVVALAARAGITTKGSTVFCTLRPCLGCLKTLIQAGVERIIYHENYSLDSDIEDIWQRIAREATITIIWDRLARVD